jgi:hypothetical protein
MAQFKWMGEERVVPPRKFVTTYGPCNQVRVPKQDGTYTVLDAPPGGFPKNAALPFNFTDERSLLVMRADPRFEEIL